MNNYNNFLEQLTLASHKNTEILIHLAYLDNLSNEELLGYLEQISNNLTEMQATINQQLCFK